MLIPSFLTSAMAVVSYNDDDYKERLIKNVKKEVKQIMEEAVTRKFVHQESSSVTSLCGAVESCLSHGLRRRALGLFRSSSTTALLHKVAKTYHSAEIVSKMVTEAEAAEGVKRSSSSGDSTTKLGSKPPLQKKGSGGFTLSRPVSTVSTTPKYLWIRLALFEKLLAGIIDHLVQNSNKYYEKDALVADPEYGSLLGHLLVGPCALDYSRMKTQDHYWTDPPADELVQRHRISSGATTGPNSPANRRPGLNVRKLVHGTSSGEETPRIPSKDYVESLHQNNKLTLLYGKNNVLVYPRDQNEPIAGYLSLHQAPGFLILKWTPNQLMNGIIDTDVDKSASNSNCVNQNTSVNYDQVQRISADPDEESSSGEHFSNSDENTKNITSQNIQPRRNSSGNWSYRAIPSFIRDYAGNQPNIYWDYALNVCISDIVYVHCHQQASDQGGTLVLVGQDGVQRSPIHFPAGGHLLAFLSCLETGLLPGGQLDPPLWTQTGKGKVFPRIRRKGVSPESNDTEESMDYVFRIVFKSQTALEHSGDMIDSSAAASPFPTKHTPCAPPNSTLTTPSPVNCGRQKRAFRFSDSTNSSTSSSKSLSGSLSMQDATTSIDTIEEIRKLPKGDSLQVLCNTMKRQIISRAFYGWLAHCRHLKTVRKHLSGLVNSTIVEIDTLDEDKLGITQERWESLFENERLTNANELYRLIYYGGVEHSLRKEVWPYLLGHYNFGSSKEEREDHDTTIRRTYETTVSEWLAVEAIVKQREREAIVKATFRCKKMSGSGDSLEGDKAIPPHQRSLSNEVFEEFGSHEDNEEESDDDDELHFEDVIEDSTATETETLQSATSGPLSEQVIVVTQHPSNRGDSLCDEKELDALADAVSGLHVQQNLTVDEDGNTISSRRSSCVSPASSQGGVYTNELLDSFALNLHRIDKDVQRCDRNYCYFTNPANLDKLRNVMCTYVWEHLDPGYMQGMCDLAAPLLVIFDDEALTYSCFTELMKRMGANFPHGGVMDTHFANMRSLIQILDAEMFDLMHQNGDYTHFYFCYRWFLLDFKRELLYEDVFSVWETIWAARHVASAHFVLFLALALVQYYRDIILDNSMDFTDIIKFFNEMAERHDAKALLKIARNLVLQLQTLIDNK